MYRRFNNQDLSMPYFRALRDVKTDGLPSIPIGPFPDHQKREDAEAYNKMKSDRMFLEDFILKLKGKKRVGTQIPNLRNAALNLPANKDGGFQLYTDETRGEFHLLLLEFLQEFSDSLDSLMENDVGSPIFVKSLDNLYRNGYLLFLLSRGAAYQMHIDSISPGLRNVLSLPRMSLNNEHADPELTALRGVMLQKSFVTWLRLMTAHMDSVETLTKFTTSYSIKEILPNF